MGILYGVNRHNSSLVIFDRFSLENYNSVTFAKSGSGKSYATKLEILRSLMFDIDIIVIDPEREYEYLSEAVGEDISMFLFLQTTTLILLICQSRAKMNQLKMSFGQTSLI